MKTTVVNVRRDDCDIYGGRCMGGKRHIETAKPGERGWLGNPFLTSKHGREEAIQLFKIVFEDQLESSKRFRNAVRKLRGKRLGCFCVSKPWQPGEGGPLICHCQVIADWLEMDHFALCGGEGTV